MAKEDIARSKLRSALANVLEYQGSGLFVEVIGLLDAIEDCYKEELLTVPAESLRYKQGAAAQVRLLRNCMAEFNANDLPKV